MALTKPNALRLASHAMKEGAVALRGQLLQDEDGQYNVGDRNLSEWLTRAAGNEVIIILASVDTTAHTRLQECSVCGRDYEGQECAHCATARARLRGT
jgi:hypothetical protein